LTEARFQGQNPDSYPLVTRFHLEDFDMPWLRHHYTNVGLNCISSTFIRPEVLRIIVKMPIE